MTPEGKVKAEIKAYLDSIGAYYFMPVQMGYGADIVDFICCVHGDFFAIEAKRPGKHATPRQVRVLKRVMDAGGLVLVAHSGAEVREFLAL